MLNKPIIKPIIKPTISIIEDNLDLQEELTFFLEAKGYQCWSAENAEVFWKKLHLKKADIFLIDVGLPGEDGFSLIKHLKQVGHFGLIIITARGGKNDYIHGLSLGADFYLVKPVNFADLHDKLEVLWQRLQQTDLILPTKQDESLINQQNYTAYWILEENENYLIAPDTQKILLTQQEKDFLGILLKQPNQVVSRLSISYDLFKYHDKHYSHRVDVIVSRLRKKARVQGFNLPIKSIFGKGLVFVAEG